jgi:hypothetical protein
MDRAPEAHDLIGQIYSWFTKGFGTADLEETKAQATPRIWLQTSGIGYGPPHSGHRGDARNAIENRKPTPVLGGADVTIW